MICVRVLYTTCAWWSTIYMRNRWQFYTGRRDIRDKPYIIILNTRTILAPFFVSIQSLQRRHDHRSRRLHHYTRPPIKVSYFTNPTLNAYSKWCREIENRFTIMCPLELQELKYISCDSLRVDSLGWWVSATRVREMIV